MLSAARPLPGDDGRHTSVDYGKPPRFGARRSHRIRKWIRKIAQSRGAQPRDAGVGIRALHHTILGSARCARSTAPFA